MALKLTCPDCATGFVLAEGQRGKKAVCPHCGASLIVTGAGMAKGNEQPRPNPASVPAGSGASRLTAIVCLIAAACVFLAVGVGLLIWCLAAPSDQDHADQAQGQQNKATDKLKPQSTLPGKHDRDERHGQKVNKNKMEILSVKPIKTLGPLAYGISPLAFSADDKILAAGGWSDPTNTSPWDPTNHDKGEFAALDKGHWRGEVKLWEIAGGKEIAARIIMARPRSLAFGPDAKTLLIASDGADIRNLGFNTGRSEVVIWDFAGTKNVKIIEVPSMGMPSLSTDGKLLAFRSRVAPDGIHLWDVGAGKRIEVLEGPLAGTFSPDGKMLATEDNSGFVLRVWHLDEGRCTSTLDEQTQRRHFMFAFSHDNKTLAVGFLGKENMVKLFDVASGKYIVTIDVLAGMPSNVPVINSLAFSPDGKLLAVGINTESKLWDVASGKAIVTLSKDAVLKAVFSHDGRLLAVGTADGRVALWEITRTSGDPPEFIQQPKKK
jgi:WD40 repeat protein